MKSLPRESIPIQFHRRAPSVGYGSRRYGRYPRTKWVSPDYSNHLSDVPSPLPRRIERVRMSITSPHHAAFPKWQEGRHPHCHFRGLRRLHSRYGPPDRSAAHRRPLSRGSNPCGYPHKPLVSYRINLRVDSSSTDDSRLRGTLPAPDMPSYEAMCEKRHGTRGDIGSCLFDNLVGAAQMGR